ncbi:HNH endonuclease [Gordonia phage Mollymur]|uniref:HNH endonuclease n=1 Tax=Gordonia phage Mollymur TaxID=2590895 RepID=A0A4Y6EBB0_9CAUD|nr:HNH endonuclease [Gordonia phage Mollymur]QDF15372.1 HNH endonuclease [Gordonia phage Mollymur]
MAWEDRDGPRLSAEFIRNRPRVLERDRHECQIQGSRCTGHATEVDHIHNRAEGGDDSMENLQAACSTCHKRKTYAESLRARRRKKEQARHPWTRIKHPGLM